MQSAFVFVKASPRTEASILTSLHWSRTFLHKTWGHTIAMEQGMLSQGSLLANRGRLDKWSSIQMSLCEGRTQLSRFFFRMHQCSPVFFSVEKSPGLLWPESGRSPAKRHCGKGPSSETWCKCTYPADYAAFPAHLDHSPGKKRNAACVCKGREWSSKPWTLAAWPG